MTDSLRIQVPVLGVPIDLGSSQQAIDRIMHWASDHESKVCTLTNVHAVVTARVDASLQAALSQADLVLPDGAPVAWSMRRKGYPQDRRVAGPDLMVELLANCEKRGYSVFLYGSTEDTLRALQHGIGLAYPYLVIAGAYSPPFGPMSEAILRDGAHVINQARPHIVMVGLGCPKQEVWMHAQRGRVHAPMVGLGAAFDFMAGVKHRAPRWMRSSGLEWMYRMFQEPRRLTGRYLRTNTAFVISTFSELALHWTNSVLSRINRARTGH